MSAAASDVCVTTAAAELLRENKRMLDKAIRELDRERAALQTQEKRTVAEIKKTAKQGQMVSAGVELGSCDTAETQRGRMASTGKGRALQPPSRNKLYA